MENLINLKKKYNEKLERNRKAEKYFKEHTVEECMKQLNLFNAVVKELSELMNKIKSMSYRQITNDEILNGFEV